MAPVPGSYTPLTPYDHKKGQAENMPGHKPFKEYDIPRWCVHPLKPESTRAAIIFPGEQNAYAGMLSQCVDLASVHGMIELATEAFGYDVAQMMAEGSAAKLEEPFVSQTLMYVADCVALQVLKEKHPEVAERPQCVAGFSIGELAALVAARVIDYDQGLIIAFARADAMRRFSQEHEMEAVVITGLDESTVESLCREAETKDREENDAENPQVQIAHYWAPGGYFCAGHRSTVIRLWQLAIAAGAEDSSIADNHQHGAHTLAVLPLAEEVREAIDSIPMRPPCCDVYFNTGHWVPMGAHPESFVDHVAKQLHSPVRWDGIIYDAMRRGVRSFYECGPGTSLKNYMLPFVWEALEGDLRPHDLTVSVSV